MVNIYNTDKVRYIVTYTGLCTDINMSKTMLWLASNKGYETIVSVCIADA